MSDLVNDVPDVSENEVVARIIKDPEIRKLAPGSEEYKVAVDNIKSTENNATEATAEAKEVRTKSKGLEKRFSELTSARDAEKARADELEKRLASLEQNTKKEPEVHVPTEDFHVKRPVSDEFATYDDYIDALQDWKLEKRDFDRQQKHYVEEVKKAHTETLSSWEKREASVKDSVEGYDALVNKEFISAFSGVDARGNRAQGIASPEAMQYLLDSENGPAMLYELADDTEMLDEFKGLSYIKQVAYLSKLESKYEKKATTKISNAPPPAKGLPKGKATTSSINPYVEKVDFNDYLKWRKKQ